MSLTQNRSALIYAFFLGLNDMSIYGFQFLSRYILGILHLFLGKMIPALLMLYLIFVLPLKLPNVGGSGLNLPQNILAWITMGLCMALALLRILRSGSILFGNFMYIAVSGILLLMLPWLWTPCPLWQDNALLRLAGLVGALLFLIALCQQYISGGVKRILLATFVVSALVQAFTAMAEAWAPDLVLYMTGSLPNGVHGVFQQRNLLGSWLAMGIGLSMYLATTALSRRLALIWLMTLYPIVTGLVLSQSRTGLIGSVVMLLIATAADLPRLSHRPLAIMLRVILLLSLVVWGGGISLWAMPSGTPADFTHTASTQQRLKVVRGTVELISRHPLAGNGLGSFEALFPSALADTGLQSQENDTFTHPHNELLYVQAEGGVVAMVGLLILGGLWLWPFVYNVRKSYSTSKTPQGSLLLSLAGLPVIIHIMTEYPLYLSAPHLLVLLLLFRCSLPETALGPYPIALPIRFIIIPIGLVGCIMVLAALGEGLQAQSVLTRAEDDMNAGLLPELPGQSWRTWTQAERLDYDRHMLAIAQPAFWRSVPAMENFTVWGVRKLAVHNDAEISAAMMAIARYRGDNHSAFVLGRKAARTFVTDSRFREENI